MINGTGPGHEPKMVLYKLSYRQDHDCIHYFNLRRAQHANQVFHHGGSDATILYDNIPAWALDKVVTYSGEVMFERKPPDF